VSQIPGMTVEELRGLVAGWRYWVQASGAPEGPQAAVVGLAVGDGLELVFDTLEETRKCRNLRIDPRVALVGWQGDVTLQVEGLADEPEGAERERVQDVYFRAFPDGGVRLSWPGITYFRVRPTWLRLSDFGVDPPAVVTWGPGPDGFVARTALGIEQGS
jgi:hypothetical protein